MKSSHRHAVTDQELERQRDELDEANRELLGALDEKNALYDEMSENTKVLQSLNNTINTNTEKTA